MKAKKVVRAVRTKAGVEKTKKVRVAKVKAAPVEAKVKVKVRSVRATKSVSTNEKLKVLMVSEGIHTLVKEAAKDDGRTLQVFIEHCLRFALKARKVAKADAKAKAK